MYFYCLCSSVLHMIVELSRFRERQMLAICLGNKLTETWKPVAEGIFGTKFVSNELLKFHII